MITRLRTNFEVGDIPLSEYPRPQFQRDSYFTLNGSWDYAIYRASEEFAGYQGKILVPFSPECLLSGCPEGTMVMPNDKLYYHRSFTLPIGFNKGHTFINFDAVDFACLIKVNGVNVGEHIGGYTPFKVEVSKVIKDGDNTIEVECTDPSDSSYHTRAKQALKHGGIWYTPQSGIWQSVWIESTPATYLKDMTIVPDIDEGTVNIKMSIEGNDDADVIVLDGDKPIAQGIAKKGQIKLGVPNFECWSPENPKLYNLAIKVGDDIVKSYFGMRKFSLMKDENGYQRLALNNKPYFHNGLLDQGYWSDGMLTPPSNAALEYDIKLVKEMGFNMLRKHIKIEPMLWYYYCDKYGILVWQDFVSGGRKYNMFAIGILPFIHINIKDNNYKFYARQDEEGRQEYVNEMHETVQRLKNVPSLAQWVPFNEGWGQFDSIENTKKLRELDNTRTIDSVSGWADQGKNSSDLKSLHIYFRPITLPKREKRCIVISEFGGYSNPTEEHMFNPDKLFGYKMFKTKDSLFNAYKKLYEKKIIPNIAKGLSATVYTQVSDVEEEINGLITYDRKVIKFPVDKMQEINAKVKY